MPFNGSGTFTLVDTLTPGTDGDATEVNTIFQDLADGLTASVAKDGQSTMTGPLKLANGSAAAPAVVAASDTDTGWYRIGANSWGFAAGGVLLFTLDSNGATLASGAFVGAHTGTSTSIPSGTKMLFQQTAAPTGWTKDTTHNNKALRVVSGNVVNGGTVAFTTAFASQSVSGTVGNTTLTVDQIPLHGHAYRSGTGTPAGANGAGGFVRDSSNATNYTFTGTPSATTGEQIGGTGGGNSHTHTFTGTAIDLAVAYVDLIIATKD